MSVNSSAYLLFLVIAVLVFWLGPVRFRRGIVLLASVVFYATWGLRFVWVPVLVSAIVYLCGRSIQPDSPGSRKWLWLGIASVASLLIVFKYRGFAAANLGIVLPAHTNQFQSVVISLAFPLGISFYTFEAIAYLVDVRQGRVKVPGFVDLCLFFFFWPNILAGPIVRARELLPQLKFEKAFEPQIVFEGLDRLIWGLVQKNVLANLLGVWVDKGFSVSAGTPSTVDGWFLAVAFGLQIYFDFAGYTNIAIGAARLLGVTLPENFRFPYHAVTPPDFWARWHMTLSRWVRDYMFFPINARWKAAPGPLYLSLLGTMAIVGLWHGAGWNYIVWGLLHGAYLVAYRVYESWKNARPGIGDSRIAALALRAITLLAVTVAWVTFRAPTLSNARVILSSMFWKLSQGATYSSAFYVLTMCVAVFCIFEPAVARYLSGLEESFATESVSPYRVLGRPIVYLCGLFLFLLFDENNAQFIYSQF